jgi:hypothetical protein
MSSAGSEHPLLDSRRLWNLWDMINFFIARFMMGHNFLHQALEEAARESQNDRYAEVPESRRGEINSWIRSAIYECVDSVWLQECRITKKHIENLLHHYKYHPVCWGELYELLNRLDDEIEHGLVEECFFHYSRDNAKLILSVDDNWDKVFKEFPSSKIEIVAGVDCYAIGHNTACVFHMVRVGELGLRTIGRECGVETVRNNVSIEWGTWGQVFQAIEPEISAIRKKQNGHQKDAALAFYDTILSDLHAIQSLYRDHTMHFRGKYDDGEAQSAMFRVRSLMMTLASKLDESSTEAIPWSAWEAEESS